jgi:hypothetical protein
MTLIMELLKTHLGKQDKFNIFIVFANLNYTYDVIIKICITFIMTYNLMDH